MRTISRIFQALRMSVNNELNNLKNFLSDSTKILKKEGRLLIITFHSIEDRIVKNFIKDSNFLYQVELITGNKETSYERSAKLRVLAKK